ncbi:hypothetical protein J7937_21750 [Vibrio parahaemolyticus]|nr:hypothetical protein [Vibrio parahaemolyticus]MCF9079969.1 hypothetical protein [Vibrio parahaemolyticus]
MAKLNIDWLGVCPRCEHDGDHYVETEKGNAEWLHDSDAVTCGSCGLPGEIEADGEVAWVNWEEEQDYYCQCDNSECGAWFQLGKQGDQCHECGVGKMQPQDVG